MKIRIVVADDNEALRKSLRDLFGTTDDIEVVAMAADGYQALELARAMNPDLVVMDVSMPDLNGVEATRRISSELPAVKVLCFSMHGDQRFVGAALEAGASGYLLKDYAVEDLVQAIRAVAAGETYLCPPIAGTVVEAYKAARGNADPSAYSLLTAREREVLQLVAEGWTSREIAAKLFVSERTVATHRRHLAEKLGIGSVAGLTKYAIRHGLTTVERDRRDAPPPKG